MDSWYCGCIMDFPFNVTDVTPRPHRVQSGNSALTSSHLDYLDLTGVIGRVIAIIAKCLTCVVGNAKDIPHECTPYGVQVLCVMCNYTIPHNQIFKSHHRRPK